MYSLTASLKQLAPRLLSALCESLSALKYIVGNRNRGLHRFSIATPLSVSQADTARHAI